MCMRWEVFAEFRALKFVFIAVESKFQRHRHLRFCTENNFVRCFPSSVVNTCVVCEGKLWCCRRPIVSSVVQEVSPITGNVLILGFNFAISPRRMGCSRSQSDSQFFCPVNKFGVDESSTSVMHNRLRNSNGTDPFFDSRDSSLSTSVSIWVYH